jgi:hypothetical protein
MKRILLTLIILFSFKAFAFETAPSNNFKLQINTGLTRETLNSKASSNTTSKSESFNQIEVRPQATYFFTKNIAAGAYYFQKSLLADFNSSGMGAYLRYYYSGQTTAFKYTLDNKKIAETPTWAPYLQIGGKRESLEAETVSISFTGLDLAIGVDWHWTDDYFFNLSANMTSQLSGNTRTLSTQAFLIGFGKALSF